MARELGGYLHEASVVCRHCQWGEHNDSTGQIGASYDSRFTRYSHVGLPVCLDTADQPRILRFALESKHCDLY